MFFDTHTHLNDSRYSADFAQVAERAVQADVNRMLIASYDISSSVEAVRMSSSIEGVICSVGIHPHDAASWNDTAKEKLKKLAEDRNSKVAAIGEIGLDYHYDEPSPDIQRKAFVEQLGLARELKLPVIIHDRDAHGDMMDIIRKEFKTGASGSDQGVFHCYSGSLEMATELIDRGFCISFAGPVTFRNARKATEIMSALPLDRILIETDCPYLAPEPFRGKRNEPAYVRFVAAKLAELKGITTEHAGEITSQNACRLFRI